MDSGREGARFAIHIDSGNSGGEGERTREPEYRHKPDSTKREGERTREPEYRHKPDSTKREGERTREPWVRIDIAARGYARPPHRCFYLSCVALAMAFVLLCQGCEKIPESSKPAPVPAPAPAPTPQVSEATGYFEAVDLDGHPLANMRPIATREPNAFDEPVAAGALTGADGKGTLVFPNNQRLFLRLWDPELKYFANNFYESVPNQGNVTDNLKVVMAPSASFEVTLLLSDGSALSQDPVEIMMSHPTRGPWWPARGTTDDTGHARFERVPPGQFVLRVTTASGHEIEVPEIQLAPGGHLDLGVLTLR